MWFHSFGNGSLDQNGYFQSELIFWAFSLSGSIGLFGVNWFFRTELWFIFGMFNVNYFFMTSLFGCYWANLQFCSLQYSKNWLFRTSLFGIYLANSVQIDYFQLVFLFFMGNIQRKSIIFWLVIWIVIGQVRCTVGSKIIRALEIILVKKRMLNAVLWNQYLSSHDH